MTDVTVQYERKLSDGNYGSEGLSLSLSETLETDPGDDALDVIFQRVRVFVLTELSKSQAERVAWAANRELNPPRAALRPAGPTESTEDAPF
jgi:hypothetical protein